MLKLVSSILGMVGMVGMAMFLYGLWMVRVWQRDMGISPFDHHNAAAPWFICTVLGAGVAFTCTGHFAAKFAHGFCLSCHMLIIFLLLLLEIATAADIRLNSDWEMDLPYDPTGKFNDFKDFVESNFDMLKWIGLLIFLAQMPSLFDVFVQGIQI